MKQVPFYPNRSDGLSCMLAALRSTLEYWSDDTYSWQQIEELTGFQGRPVWTARVWSYLATHGFEIYTIEAFDYKRFAEEGKSYLEEYLPAEELEWQLKNSDILKLPTSLPEFLKTVKHEARSPELADLDRLLTEGYLVLLTLNSRVLNGKPGYASHMVLVHDKVGSEYIAHDPGLLPVANRRIEADILWEAMGKERNRVEMTGIRRKAHSV